MNETWQTWEGEVVDGKFHLRQFLAGDENSAVFLTEFDGHGLQKAAIKLVRADPEIAALRLSRWRASAKLSHPHLIRLFQTGTVELAGAPLLYAVMEYADEDLSQVLPHRPLTAVEARQMLEHTVEALAYLHGNGYVHSRLTPSNIMAVDDELKISSDALCRIGEAPDSKTAGIYYPPEAHRQGSSPAGDIWSLGVTLVESLTQHLPVWENAGLDDPLLPDTLPAPFHEIAGHCLRRDPQRRWTAADILAHLRPAAPTPATATPKPSPTRPQSKSAKSRYFAPAAALGLLALAALLAGPGLLKRQPNVHESAPKFEPEPEPNPSPEHDQPAATNSGEAQTPPSGSPTPTPLPSPAGAGAQSADITPGEVVSEALPDVPAKARRTITGTVRVSVKVRVDPSGRVASAEIDSRGPSGYFAGLALKAARRWEFIPAKVNGQPVPSDWMLRFEFTSTATRSVPAFVHHSIEP